MLGQMMNVEMVRLLVISALAVIVIMMIFLNKNTRLTKFRFEFKSNNIAINTEAEYAGVNIIPIEKAIEENPNDLSS